MEYRRFTRPNSIGLLNPHYQYPMKQQQYHQGPIYGIGNPVTQSKFLLSPFGTTAMISSVPVSRTFTTEPHGVEQLSMSCDQLPAKVEEKSSSIFEPIVGMMSRMFSGIMKSLEEVVSPRSEKPELVELPPAYETLDIALFFPPPNLKSQIPNDMFEQVPVIESAVETTKPSPTDQLPTIDPITETSMPSPETSSNQLTKAKSIGDNMEDCQRKKRAKDCLCRMYSPHRKSPPKASGKHTQCSLLRRKAINKNRSEKYRHEILADIIDAVESEEELEEPVEPELEHTPLHSTKITIISRRNSVDKVSTPPTFILRSEDFPTIPSATTVEPSKSSPKRAKPSYNQSHPRTRLDSDDFVIFDSDSAKSTPSIQASPSRPSLSQIFDRLSCGNRRNRVRQLSECSDDSFVIFFESDGENHVNYSDYDDDEDDDDDSDVETCEEEEDDDEDCDSDIDSVKGSLIQQLDSGFEENEKKKVTYFCFEISIPIRRPQDGSSQRPPKNVCQDPLKA